MKTDKRKHKLTVLSGCKQSGWKQFEKKGEKEAWEGPCRASFCVWRRTSPTLGLCLVSGLQMLADCFMLKIFLKGLSWDCSKSCLDCPAQFKLFYTINVRNNGMNQHSASVQWNFVCCMVRFTKGLTGSSPSRTRAPHQNFEFCSLSLLSPYGKRRLWHGCTLYLPSEDSHYSLVCWTHWESLFQPFFFNLVFPKFMDLRIFFVCLFVYNDY